MECAVIEIVPNSPAHICGKIAIGDRLLQVDGKDAIMASSPRRSKAHLQQLCFGLVGSTVHLVLASRGAAGQHREMPLGEAKETVASNAIEKTIHIDLTRVSASEVMISNFNLDEAVNMLERFVNLVVARGCAV
jgi:C-terminal processing protease CtpA/Prc